MSAGQAISQLNFDLRIKYLVDLRGILVYIQATTGPEGTTFRVSTRRPHARAQTRHLLAITQRIHA